MRNKTTTRKMASTKSRYKINNWSAYNKALKQRGSLEIWINPKIAEGWYYQGLPQQGAQFEYSDGCIELACIIKEVYRLGYRQTEGFLESLVKLMGWEVKVPHYTVINRRRKNLKIKISKTRKKKKMFLLFDSTGGKVDGEGEWKVRQHGWGKHRTWRKIHLAIDEDTGQVEGCGTTTNSVADEDMVEPLLNQVRGTVVKMAGDGAYDKHKVYRALAKRKIKPIIPPRKNARIGKHGNSKGKPAPRDQSIRLIRKLGRKDWKKKVGYHRRSIAETTMFRFKKIFGDKLISKNISQQQIEVRIKCKILNQIAAIGLPEASKIEKAA